jgi:hypothetical protein
MRRSPLKAGVIPWVLVRFVRTCWTRIRKTASGVARKLFLPSPELRFHAESGETSDRVMRLRPLAWHAKRQYCLACRFGALAEELLAKGRIKSARRVARGAFLHWQSYRKADQLFRAERIPARQRVVA